MKNPRRTLFYIFLAYNLILFLGALYMDSKQNDLGFLLNVKYYIPWMKYFTFFGLVLFFIAYVVVGRDIRKLSKNVSKSKDEHTELKAKLFDFQEEKRLKEGDTPQAAPPQIETPSDTDTSDSETPDDESKA